MKAGSLSYSLRAFLTGTDTDALRQVEYKDFPIAYLARTGPFNNRINRWLYKVIIDRNFKANLFNQIDLNNISAITFGKAGLLTATDNIGNCHFTHARFKQGLLHIGKLGWLNDRNYHLHKIILH